MNALASPEVGKFINQHFVSSFQKVATFQIVNGQKQGGNVAAYFCAADGRVLNAVAGPVDAGTLLREAQWVVESVKKALEESQRTSASFKALFRQWHARRLREEHGLVVEPVTFDAPEAQDDNGALTYRDPTGRPLVPVLPPPPIEGPDVEFKAKRAAADKAMESAGAPALQDRSGRRQVLGNQGRVHMLLAAHALVKIEKVYGTVFENILGEKVTTKPVVTIGALPGSHREVCLHCSAKRAEGDSTGKK